MVFGDVIGAETGAVVLLGQLQPRLEQFGERYCVIVEMIEHSEFQSQHYLLILCLGCVVDGYTCRSRSAQNGLRSSRLRILPVGVRGSASTKSIVRGAL